MNIHTMRAGMGLALLATIFIFGMPAPARAQNDPNDANSQRPNGDTRSDAKPDSKADAQKSPSPPAAQKEESSTTDHTIRIGTQSVPYRAIASTMLLKNEKDEPTASIFSVAYIRSDVKDPSARPIAFLYNGGPGSGSAWLQLGAFGPRRVVTPNAEAAPPPPYELVDNPDCLLDKADLVFVDPVGTGFSRAAGKSQDKDFWNVDEDVRSIAQFIQRYVTLNNRWNSPKFLIGESYGTFRSAVLANYLQSHDGMDLNGIVLISTVLDTRTISFNPGDDESYIFYLPSYAATAWYHNVLKDRPADLNQFLADARQFATTEYASALLKGSRISPAEKSEIVKKLSRFTGLSEEYLAMADMRVSLPQFNAELQRSRGLITGRLDARYSGFTNDPLSEYADFDPLMNGTMGAFTAAFQAYVTQELKFPSDQKYELLNMTVARDWEWKHATNNSGAFPGAANAEPDLVSVLIANPHLQVEAENGLFDLGTPFLATEYTMDHLGLPEKLQGNIHLKYYDVGHMIYLTDDGRNRLKNNVGQFIDSASK